MRAMALNGLRTPLVLTERDDRRPGPGEIRVTVGACGVCRTDLHVVDGDLPDPMLPIIPGHEIVGRIDSIGIGVDSSGSSGLHVGQRVGIPWLGHTCGVCPYCRAQHENLCDRPLFTGFTRDGGFASSVIADSRYAFPLGDDGPGLWHDDAAMPNAGSAQFAIGPIAAGCGSSSLRAAALAKSKSAPFSNGA